MWEAAGGYAPTIGIIGAVMGLIQVMKHLEDIKAVGHGIAVAFVATVYGVASANIFFLPVANKLKGRIRAATLIKDLMLEGVVGIVEGLNPTLIRMKLEAYQDPRRRSRARTRDGQASSAKRCQPFTAAAAGGLAHHMQRKRGRRRTRITNAGWYPTPISSPCCSPSSW